MCVGSRYSFGLAAVYLCYGHGILAWSLEVMVLFAHSCHFWDLSQIQTHQDLNSILMKFMLFLSAQLLQQIAKQMEQVIRQESATLRALVNFLKEILRRQVLFQCFLSLKQLALINLGDRMYKSNSSS